MDCIIVFLKNIAPIVTSLTAVVMAITAILGFFYVKKRLDHDSNWKKTETAKDLNNQMMDDPRARNARRMIDWTYGRFFDVNQKINESEKPCYQEISRDDIKKGLRTDNEAESKFDCKDIFIRDSFDKFFYFMGVFEHYIRQDLIKFDDVKYPMEYYVSYLRSTDPNKLQNWTDAERESEDEKHYGVFKQYLKNYGFHRSQEFIDRFDNSKKNRICHLIKKFMLLTSNHESIR